MNNRKFRFLISATLIFLSLNAYSRDGGNIYFPADGFVEVSTKDSTYRVISGISEFCVYGAWGDTKRGCKWLRAEDYIQYVNKRDDLYYTGMSNSPYSNIVTLYYREARNKN